MVQAPPANPHRKDDNPMRNDYIGTSIDGDARAACNGRNTGNTGCCGTRQPRTCGCETPTRQIQDYDCNRSANDCGCNDNRPAHHNDCNQCDRDPICQNHSNNCGCGKCNNDCSYQNRTDNCDCNNDYSRQNRDNCACNGRAPAMVYTQHHDLDSIYGCQRALLRGTLFGCLDKPMCHEHCNENPCFTQCQADKFTIWELRLYLNTHPCDQKALALLRKLTQQMDDDCGCTFDADCNRWSWTDGPWPWEYQRCCGKEA